MIVCIGGQARKTGKSSVVAGLIRALPQARWTAVKISRHAHSGEPGRRPSLREQTHADATDTGRFLAAGAERAYLIEAAGASIGDILPWLRTLAGPAGNLIVESTSLAASIRPDLFLMVVDPGAGESKPNVPALIEIADALVVIERSPADAAWPLPPAKPRFPVKPPEYVSAELVRFVARHLALPTRRGGS